MELNKDNLVYFKAKEESLEKLASALKGVTQDLVEAMLAAGKSTLNPSVIGMGLSRPPVQNLFHKLQRSDDLGKVIGDVQRLTDKASHHRKSIRDSYLGLFGGSRGGDNPLRLLSQAQNRVYKPLPTGKGYHNPGASVPELGNREIEDAIFSALARHSNKAGVDDYARNLIKTKDSKYSDLNNQIKSISDDFLEGRDAVIRVPTGKDSFIPVNVDKPIASFNGSPVINIEKTHDISGVETLNAAHNKLLQQYQKKSNSGINQFDPEVMELQDKINRSQDFIQQFGSKMKLMSSSPDVVNKAKFTLDDLDSVDRVRAFFRNPYLKDNHKLLPDQEIKQISDEIVNTIQGAVSQSGHSKDVIQNALKGKLGEIAADPRKTNFMQGFQFARYDAKEMQEVMKALKGTKSGVMDEKIRLVADAMGAGGLAGMIGLGGYAMMKPKEVKTH